jgi:hypothetical protein
MKQSAFTSRAFHSQRLSSFGEQLIPTDFPSPGVDARSAKKAKIKYLDIH